MANRPHRHPHRRFQCLLSAYPSLSAFSAKLRSSPLLPAVVPTPFDKCRKFINAFPGFFIGDIAGNSPYNARNQCKKIISRKLRLNFIASPLNFCQNAAASFSSEMLRRQTCPSVGRQKRMSLPFCSFIDCICSGHFVYSGGKG